MENQTWRSWLAVVLLFVAAMALAGFTVYVGTRNPPNVLATAVLQAVTLIFGIYGSYLLSKLSLAGAAFEVVRPHAKSAFRRMLNLYGGLGRIQDVIDAQMIRLADLKEDKDQASYINFEHVRSSMTLLSELVAEQIFTTDDALEDWRDLVPDEVQKILDKAKANESGNGGA